MSERQIFGKPIELPEQWAVASYLIAISPDLQSTAKQRRETAERTLKTKAALNTAITVDGLADSPDFDLGEARVMFEMTCSQCHELSEVDAYPLATGQDIRELLERMVENGLEATEAEMKQIGWYLT